MRAALCLALLAAACAGRSEKRAYEYTTDMERSAAYRSFSAMTFRRPVPGTIARDYQPFHYAATEEDAVRAGRELRNPFGADSLASGKELYSTYCYVCHGAQGRGDGPLVPRIPNPPSYLSQRVMEMPEGRIFHVITRGSGRMPSYAALIRADERWKIVAYVQHLQGVAAGFSRPEPSGRLKPAPTRAGGGR